MPLPQSLRLAITCFAACCLFLSAVALAQDEKRDAKPEATQDAKPAADNA